MRYKAIYSECSLPVWVDVAKILLTENEIEPCYWTGDWIEKAVREGFPRVVFHKNGDALRGIPPSELAGMPTKAVDQALLRKLAYDESIVLKMMERIYYPKPIPDYQDRINFYHSLIAFWTAVLDRYQPDYFLSPSSPHLIYDYVLYALCRERGIRTITFYSTSLGLMYPVQKFDEGSLCLARVYRKLQTEWHGAPIRISGASEKLLQTIRKNYDVAMPSYTKEVIEEYRQVSGRLESAANGLPESGIRKEPQAPRGKNGNGRRIYFHLRNRAVQIYRRIHKQRMILPATDRDALEHGKSIEAARAKLDFILAKYQSLTKPVELNIPYVFAALSYQPENTTSPEGGMFVHQHLMVDLLSKAAPAGWLVYVKEHMAQFVPSRRGDLSRDPSFYEKMVSLPNVRLVPASYSPFALMNHAKAVATVTGTVGWEALVRRKPVLTFGYPWYMGCEGVFYTPDEESCRSAFERIESGYEVDDERVKLFVKALEQVGIRAYADPGYYEDLAQISHEDNVAAIVGAIQANL